MDTNAISYNSSSTSPEPRPQRDVAPRANTACRKLLRTFFKLNNFTHKKVEEPAQEPASPIVLHLEENKSLHLRNLTIVTKPTLHRRGICTTHLLYTQDKGFTCLTFEVNTATPELDAKFTTLSLNICLLDSETKDVSTLPDDFYSSGVAGRKYRFWTKRSLPLNVKLNICVEYMKKGKMRHFETPGGDKFINYRVLVQKGE